MKLTGTRSMEPTNRLIKIAGKKAQIIYVRRGCYDKTTRTRGSLEKARTLLGNELEVPMKAGHRSVHEWSNENWEKIQKSVSYLR